MPNWCSNFIEIRGTDQREIAEIAKAMQDGRFCDQVIPVPEDLKRDGSASFGGDLVEQYDKIRAENREKHGYDSWYEFCTNRWGTKWDVDFVNGVDIAEDGLSVSGSFDSAWAPPMGIVERLVEQGLEVTLYYYEPGMGFVGKYNSGVDDYYELSGFDSKTVRQAIGDDLDDFFGISESMAEYEEENPEVGITVI
jgi:hypothetical protein